MGYVEKSELMDTLISSNLFTSEEIKLIDKLILSERIYENEAELRLPAIQTLQDMGLLQRFYNVCEQHGYFPVWLNNVRNGVDTIE